MDPQNLSKLSILYVEDEIDLRDTTSDSLKKFCKRDCCSCGWKRRFRTF